MMEPERTSIPHRVRRALPPVLGVILGLVIMRRYADEWLYWLGFATFLLSSLRIVLHPVRWWEFVVTGAPTPPTDVKYTHPGAYQVELLSAGNRPIEVVKALREVCGLGLVEAQQRVDDAPSVIASHISESSAAQVRDRIDRAGGTATFSVSS